MVKVDLKFPSKPFVSAGAKDLISQVRVCPGFSLMDRFRACLERNNFARNSIIPTRMLRNSSFQQGLSFWIFYVLK